MSNNAPAHPHADPGAEPDARPSAAAGGSSFEPIEQLQATDSDATRSHFISDFGDSELDWLVEEDSAFSAEPVELSPGESFAGFRIVGRLGRGGMATVYRALDPEGSGHVALKILNRGLVRSARHLARFRREAQLASRLRHPRIVTTHTYGELGGCAYLTMQLIDGPTLDEVVDRSGPLEPWHAAEIVKLIAQAVDAAHRQRVVHRDLKPSNVMLHPADGPLLLDFGLAKDIGRDPTLTETGEILGTPAFLAPEQTEPGDVPPDQRLDVYGLGAILFFLLTGQAPHPGETAMEVINHIMRADPLPLRRIDPELPAPLETICAKCLSRDPRDRYQTAAELADDLTRFQERGSIRARMPGRLQRFGRLLRQHPLTTVLAAALLLMIASAGVAVRALATRIALHDRSEQAMAVLEQAQADAHSGDHPAAERGFLQAMLLAKGAFLEQPSDDRLRAALARAKRERAAYAEGRGNWALAHELRVNLARLHGRPLPEPPRASSRSLVTVEGLGPGARVELYAWIAGRRVQVAAATHDEPRVPLSPGKYLALHLPSNDAPHTTYLVVVDGLQDHSLRLSQDAGPAGVFRLPPIPDWTDDAPASVPLD